MIVNITNNRSYIVTLLTDVTTLGSDDGITDTTVAFVEQYKAWFYPDTILASASSWTQMLGQHTGFVGTEQEWFTLGQQDVIAATTSDQTVVQVGELTVDGTQATIRVKATIYI